MHTCKTQTTARMLSIHTCLVHACYILGTCLCRSSSTHISCHMHGACLRT
ncbi:hypothetical protein HMPREF3190_01294 [Umbribacter vaginalis]|nr:hypothetical protein HMPREF3190_01294 [Coriobacteriales bacterium DNF00809]